MMIGERVKLARRAAGLSLRELADRVGVLPRVISKYERGLDVPSSGVLLRLAEALGVKIEYFFRTRRVNLSVLACRKNSVLHRKQEEEGIATEQEEEC